MPLSKKTHQIFESHYGTTLREASRSNELALRLGKVFASGKEEERRDEHYGRGYVGFGNSVSPERADQSTMRMFSRW